MKNNVQVKQVHVQKNEQTMVILGKVVDLTFGAKGPYSECLKKPNASFQLIP